MTSILSNSKIMQNILISKFFLPKEATIMTKSIDKYNHVLLKKKKKNLKHKNKQ